VITDAGDCQDQLGMEANVGVLVGGGAAAAGGQRAEYRTAREACQTLVDRDAQPSATIEHA
jgi:hypothetical protein